VIHPVTSLFVDYGTMVPESMLLRTKMFTPGSCKNKMFWSNSSKNSLLGLSSPICIMKCLVFSIRVTSYLFWRGSTAYVFVSCLHHYTIEA
jgi:type IV secretory pathway VirB3-like protein